MDLFRVLYKQPVRTAEGQTCRSGKSVFQV